MGASQEDQMMDMASYDTGAAEEASYCLQLAIRGFPGLATIILMLALLLFLEVPAGTLQFCSPLQETPLEAESPWAINTL